MASAFAIPAWNTLGPSHYLIAGVITVGFTLAARWLRGVTNGGAVAGAFVCFLLYIGAGPSGFLALVVVFVLTWSTTQWGYHQKQILGIAERRSGRRATQVLANIGIAALCAFLHALNPARTIYLLAVTAALSEAAADTVSSEMGQVSAGQPRLITTRQRVPAGTNGGMTVTGTLTGMGAAAFVSLICALTGMISWKWVIFAAFGGIGGMFADSLLGATLERRGWLNNDGVNLASTVAAVALSLLAYFCITPLSG